MRARVYSLLVLAACSGQPDVAVRSRVGEREAEPDVATDLKNVKKVFDTVLADARNLRRSLGPEPEVPSVVDSPATSEALADLIAELRAARIDDIGGPARRIASAAPAIWPQVRDAILAPRKAPKGDYRSMLAAIGGDVPNRYGHFKLAWRKAHGFSVKISDDWLEDLLALPSSRVSRPLRKVYRDCVLESALLRAASRIGQDPELSGAVVDALLDAAYLHAGTFRDEVGRSIRAVGDPAVPHLIGATARLATQRKRKDDDATLRAEYARYQLDRMDRLHPAPTIEALRGNTGLTAAVITAYGQARMGEAAEVLLDHVASPVPRVRGAARDAFLSYVTGPAPKAVRRTVRLLGGGTKKTRAYLSFRQRALIAIRDRLAAEASMLLEPECEVRREDGTQDQACEAQAVRLTRAYFAWIDLRRKVEEATRVDRALAEPDSGRAMAMLDRLLAENPSLDAADRLVPFYRRVAEEAKSRAEFARAGQLYRKASMLVATRDAAVATELTVRALLAEAATAELDANGREMLLGSARELAPDDDEVAAALAEARTELVDDARDETGDRLLYGIAILLFGLPCLALAGRPLRSWLAGC